MNTLLKDVGIAVDHVLVRQYGYERGYQEQIESRKVQDQLVFTNRSMGEAAKEDATRRKIEAEGKANVDVEQGLIQTKKAVVSARSSRKMRWWCCGIFIVILVRQFAPPV